MPLKPRTGFTQVFHFVGRTAAPKRAVAVRKAAKLGNHHLVALGVVQRSAQIGLHIGLARFALDQGGKGLHAARLHGPVFAVLHGQVDKHARHGGQLLVGAIGLQAQ